MTIHFVSNDIGQAGNRLVFRTGRHSFDDEQPAPRLQPRHAIHKSNTVSDTPMPRYQHNGSQEWQKTTGEHGIRSYPPKAPAKVALQRNEAMRKARSSGLYQKLR